MLDCAGRHSGGWKTGSVLGQSGQFHGPGIREPIPSFPQWIEPRADALERMRVSELPRISSLWPRSIRGIAETCQTGFQQPRPGEGLGMGLQHVAHATDGHDVVHALGLAVDLGAETVHCLFEDGLRRARTPYLF